VDNITSETADACMIASDKGRCILFAFQVEKNATEAAETIRRALGGPYDPQGSIREISRRRLLTLKTGNAPGNLKNFKTRNCSVSWMKTRLKKKLAAVRYSTVVL
jgi:hypothetical protein